MRGKNGFTVETWRQAAADRPETRANAGDEAGGAGGDNGGDKVETEWRQTLSLVYPAQSRPRHRPRRLRIPAPSPGIRAPENRAMLQPAPAAYRRDDLPGAAALVAAEPDPNQDAGPACVVLIHPAFDKPAVVNVRRPGPKRGVVSLGVVRRRRAQADRKSVV